MNESKETSEPTDANVCDECGGFGVIRVAVDGADDGYGRPQATYGYSRCPVCKGRGKLGD